MSDSLFAFRRSTSEESEANIHTVMNELLATLEQILDAVEQLEPHWIATEADTYYTAAKKLNKSAEGITNNLHLVHNSLTNTRTGTDELRGNISATLAQWN